jgi:hypothetical protein
MANVNRPSGLTPVKYANGAAWDGKLNMYYIDSANASAFAKGDPVMLSGTGDSNGVPGIVLATAGATNPVLGCVMGMAGTKYGASSGDPASLGTIVVPATKTKNYYVLVCDDPDVIFEIQEGTDGAALSQTSIGLNFDLKSGTNNGFVSGWVMDNDTGATGATLQLKALGLAQRPDNAFGTYAKWLVKINLHAFRAGVAGV